MNAEPPLDDRRGDDYGRRETDREVEHLKERAQAAEQKLRDSTMNAILASLQAASIRADADSKMANATALSAAAKIETHEVVCVQRYEAIDRKLESMGKVPETLAALVATIETSQANRQEQFVATVKRLDEQDEALAAMSDALKNRAIAMLAGFSIALLALIGYLIEHYVLSKLPP